MCEVQICWLNDITDVSTTLTFAAPLQFLTTAFIQSIQEFCEIKPTNESVYNADSKSDCHSMKLGDVDTRVVPHKNSKSLCNVLICFSSSNRTERNQHHDHSFPNLGDSVLSLLVRHAVQHSSLLANDTQTALVTFQFSNSLSITMLLHSCITGLSYNSTYSKLVN